MSARTRITSSHEYSYLVNNPSHYVPWSLKQKTLRNIRGHGTDFRLRVAKILRVQDSGSSYPEISDPLRSTPQGGTVGSLRFRNPHDTLRVHVLIEHIYIIIYIYSHIYIYIYIYLFIYLGPKVPNLNRDYIKANV